MSDILTEIMKKNMDLVLLHILSLLGGGSLHRCRQVCKSWNRYIIDEVWGTKAGRDKMKKRLKWCWENVTPISSVMDFWDEMYMENWSLAIDNDFIVCGLSRFAEGEAKVIERSSGDVLETLKVEASLLVLHASTLPVSPANLRHGSVFMVKIGPEHIVTAANFANSTGVGQEYVIISIWRKDNFELVKIVWDYSDMPPSYQDAKFDLSQGLLIYKSFIGDLTDCICINLCNDYARTSLQHNNRTNHVQKLVYIKIFQENVLTALLLGTYLFIQVIEVNIWSPSTGQCLSSKEITLTDVGTFMTPTFSFFNPHLLVGFVHGIVQKEDMHLLQCTSRILLQMWDLDTGNNRVVQDINVDGFLDVHLVKIDEHFIYSIIEDGDGVTQLKVWRTEELKNLTVTKQDMWQRSVDIENVPEGVSLDGVVIDHNSIVSVTDCGSTIRNLDFWH